MSRRSKIIQALTEHRNTSLVPELRGPQGGVALKLNQDNFSMSVAAIWTVLCPGGDSLGITFLKFHRYCQRGFFKRTKSIFLCIEVFPGTRWVEWVEATSAAEAEISFDIGFAWHSVTLPWSPGTCKYPVMVHAPEHRCQLHFQVWCLISVSSAKPDQRSASDLQVCRVLPAKPRCSGIQTALKDQPAECHSICSCLRWASLTQLFSPARGQSLSTEKLPFGSWSFCAALGGTTMLGHAVQRMAVCAKPLRLAGFLGKKGDRVAKTFRASSHFCHSRFWGLNRFLLPLNAVSALKRAADSNHRSFDKISKSLKHCFWVKGKRLILLENFTLPLLWKLFPKTSIHKSS